MALIDRSGAEALIPEEYSRQIIQAVPEASVVMRLGRRLPNMSRNQLRMPVLAGLVTAEFVDGEPTNTASGKGLKRTSAAAWANKYINAAELAVIVPIPENVLDDADYDIWGEVQPRIVEAFGVAFDQAVLYGTNKPTDWPSAILAGATAAGHVVTMGAVADNDLYDDILGEDGVVARVEEDGYLVTGHVAALTLRAKLRGLRDTTGQPIFLRSMQETTRYELDGTEVLFPRNGAIDPAETLLIAGDWSQLVYAIRQDVTYKVLTEASIYDTDGQTVLYRLAQQDMVALRATLRLGWQLPNPINRVNPNDSTRYPFAVLAPAATP